MCQNAEKTTASILAAEIGPVTSLLTVTGLINTPQGVAVLTSYKAAVTALQNWVPGTAAQDVSQVVTAFSTAFGALPLPADVEAAASLIETAVQIVLGVIEANSPAPTTTGVAAPAEVQEAHADAVAKKTEAMVEAKTGFKLSWIDKGRIVMGDHELAGKKFLQQWEKLVPTLGPKYAALKQ